LTSFTCFTIYDASLYLHSFPTRRSSDLSKDYIREIQALVGFDLAQLHGSETDDDIRDLGIASVKTLRVADSLPTVQDCTNAAWRSEEHTLNSSHQIISYAVFCLKKKKNI